MKHLLAVWFLACLMSGGLSAQSDFDPTYQRLQSGSFVQDKNFYLFTVIGHLPEVQQALAQDEALTDLLGRQQARITELTEASEFDSKALLDRCDLTQKEKALVSKRLRVLFQANSALQHMVQRHLRPSGMFIRYAEASDETLLVKAWEEAHGGMAFIIDTYGKGKKGRYPKIDSVSYDVQSFFYQRVIRSVVQSVEDDFEPMDLVYQPMLQLALTLLDINNRDEAGRHEPMAQGENRKAVEYIPGIDWDRYRYACIMQPGHGPEKEGIALSPLGKMRVKLVAERYHAGWAPLIILSGGYVHPYQTPFAEATEMKKALIEQYGVPERAIIIEPHARHTTTNFRNAARLMYQYGIPTDKLSVCTTTFDQIIYITDPKWKFDERNQRELGYLPYTLFEKVSRNDLEFKPVITSLHADPLDPLDP